MRVPIRILVVALATLLAVACGGDDDGDVLASSDASTDAESAPATEDTTGDDNEAMTGDGDSEWCERIREVQDSDEPSPLNFSFTGLDPATLETQFTDNLEVVEEWADTAPPEIDDQVATMLETYTSFVELASDAEWNLIALGSDPEFLAIAEDPAIQQAANDIDAYSRDVCGIDFGVPAQTVPAPAPGTDDDAAGMVDEFLSQFGLPAGFLNDEQLACMEGELSKAFPDGLPEDLTLTADNLELFDTAGSACGIGTP